MLQLVEISLKDSGLSLLLIIPDHVMPYFSNGVVCQFSYWINNESERELEGDDWFTAYTVLDLLFDISHCFFTFL